MRSSSTSSARRLLVALGVVGAPLVAFTGDAREWLLSASRDGSRLAVGDIGTGITRVFDL